MQAKVPAPLASFVAALAALAPAAARAQVVNGDFQSGTFAPWIITDTPAGRSMVTALSSFDIDGPGPLPTSIAAQFMAGQTQGNSGPQGIIIHQTVQLEGSYTFHVNWGVYALIAVPNESAGIFDLLLDNAVIAHGAAPALAFGNQRAYGELSVSLTPTSGAHDVGVRVTRAVPAGYEQFQYVDNFSITPACPADFNHDGTLNSQDFFDYLTAFFASDPAADFNLDGLTNSQDFFDFLAEFFDGCA